MPRSLLACFLLFCAAPALLGAQALHGVVTDRSTASPLPGVVVTLLDEGGRSVARALSNENGEYRLVVPRPGAFRLRALRIGFRPVTTSLFRLAAGADASHPLALASIPVALDTFRVSSRRTCDLRPDSARATYQVWEQVRAALAAAELTERSRSIGARILMYERALEPLRERVMSQVVRVREGLTRRPWQAHSADALHQSGYVETAADGSVFYHAPDLDVLLSDRFLEDHCLRMSGESDAARIGIEFEPGRERRRIPEIRGTIWLDRRTAEAQLLEFRYVNVTRDQSAGRAGGEIRFVRMKNGAWMIAGWHIRMPVLEMRSALRGVRGAGGNSVSVREIRVEGGELALATRGRDTLWSRPAIPLRGHLADSITGRPWVGALVSVRGAGIAARSDSTGRFRIGDVIPGQYTLEIASPELEAAGVAHRVTFTFLDSMSTLSARLPPAREIARTACQDTTGGIVAGVVRGPDGQAVRDARVVAEWSEIHTTQNATVRWVGTATNQSGRYLLCGVPEREVELRVESDSGGVDPVTLHVRSAAPSRADFRLSGVARRATLRGIVRSAVDGRPLADVEVALPGLARTTFTNVDGGFRLRDVPPGMHHVVARRVGYRVYTDSLVLGAGRVADYTVIMSTVPTLESVDVTASARIPSFEEHRAIGLGHFLTRADLDKWGTRDLKAVLSQMPRSALVHGVWSQATIVSPRLSHRSIYVPGKVVEGQSCGDGLGRPWPCACYPQVYVDNMLMNWGDPTPAYSISDWSAERVEAIEWYPGYADIPMKYMSKQKVVCGVLVIHTRRYEARKPAPD